MGSRNFFELFGLPVSYSIPTESLELAYRKVQGQVHPDRFAGASEAERRVAMQLATEANEAYRTLRNPLKRAIYLLGLEGVDVAAESNTAMEPAFLMRQMEWRESIEDAQTAKNIPLLTSLADEVAADKRARFTHLEAALNAGAAQPAAQAARQLLFIEKLEQDIGDAIEMLETA